jgi:hypothetical protein
MEITIEPVIVAAVLTVIAAISLWFIKEYKLEPRRWLKTTRQDYLQARLAVYGQLVMILQTCRVKAMRQNLVTNASGREDLTSLASIPTEGNQEDYLMENPYDADRMQELFEKSNYLLSNPLKEEWTKAIREDTYFAMFSSRKREPQCLLVKLRQMHKIAENEYDGLKSEYEDLTGIHIPKEHLT